MVFSGIGNQSRFLADAADAGVSVAAAFRFRDHYRYLRKDLELLAGRCREEKADFLLTTEKDTVRLESDMRLFTETLGGLAVLYPELTAHCVPDGALESKVMTYCRRRDS